MLKAHTMLCRGEKRGVHASNPAVLHSQLTAVAARPNVRLDQTGWIRSLSATLICITEDTTENRKDVFLKLWNYKTSSDTLSATFLSLQLVDLNLHTKSLWIPECLFFSSMLSNPFKPLCTTKLCLYWNFSTDFLDILGYIDNYEGSRIFHHSAIFTVKFIWLTTTSNSDKFRNSLN